ncbi:hypothetical protein OE903_04075 [Bacillus sp. B6(2022)]|nr:hypothetical protein [Bacillus sp. B6(2022)]
MNQKGNDHGKKAKRKAAGGAHAEGKRHAILRRSGNEKMQYGKSNRAASSLSKEEGAFFMFVSMFYDRIGVLFIKGSLDE